MDLLNIAQKIRRVRQQQNMTVEELARKCGLSKGFISRLENFRINASVGALSKVSSALGISMSELFSEEDKPIEYVFGRISEGEKVERNQSDKFGISYYSLAFQKRDRRLEPFTIEYRPASHQRGMLMHDADEFYVLLEGEVIFSIGDEKDARLMKAGDTVYLSRNQPHSVMLAEGCEFAKAIIVYENNNFQMP